MPPGCLLPRVSMVNKLYFNGFKRWLYYHFPSVFFLFKQRKIKVFFFFKSKKENATIPKYYHLHFQQHKTENTRGDLLRFTDK